MAVPRVFVSYSHDSPEHKSWVLGLATDLRTNGVDAVLDQWDLSPGQDISLFMQRGISDADRVLLICSQKYVQKADSGAGGVGYERLVVTAEVVETIDTKKFVPIVRGGGGSRKTPTYLGPRLYIDFEDDAQYQGALEALLREIHGVVGTEKPPLGKSPFSGVPVEPPPRVTGSTGYVAGGGPILDGDWFAAQAGTAEAGLAKLNIRGSMELRFGLHEPIQKSQIELLEAVEASNIRTFGWPIGVVIRGDAVLSPKPSSTGIFAELPIEKSSFGGRSSYDYWAASGNGDFYLRQDLFEDQRGENSIFFNTRIVRVAESLMFMSSMYDKLGVPPSTKISARVSHMGLRGRNLSAVARRFIMPGKISYEDVSRSEIVTTIEEIETSTTTVVRKICDPMFMLFDFTSFPGNIYDDVVTRFKAGEAS